MSERLRVPARYARPGLFDLTQIKGTDARQIVLRYLPLTNKTKYSVGLCPFHEEKTPSFYVFQDGFHCFGCAAHGDVIEFVERIENIDFVSAVAKLGGAEVLDFSEAARRHAKFVVVQEARAAESDYQRQKRLLEDKMIRRDAGPEAAFERDWRGERQVAELQEVRHLRNHVEEADELAVESAATTDPADLPDEQWIVDGILPAGGVCLLSGDESLGKSQILIDLMIAAGLGQPWLGNQVECCKSFGWFCEDPRSQIIRRKERYLAARGAAREDLEDRMLFSSRLGRESLLLHFQERSETCRETRLWQLLNSHGQLEGRQILAIDTIPDAINGDPNRGRVATNTVLFFTKWAADNDACVILTIHPDKAGVHQYAGARQWRSKSYTHLHFERPMVWSKEQRKMIPEGPRGDRWLSVSRQKFGQSGKKIPLRWDNNLRIFVLDEYRERTRYKQEW